MSLIRLLKEGLGLSSGFDFLARAMVLFGLVLVLLGVLFLVAGKIPYIGKLPGDIYIQKRNFTFYFPLTTSIIISIILTLIFTLFRQR